MNSSRIAVRVNRIGWRAPYALLPIQLTARDLNLRLIERQRKPRERKAREESLATLWSARAIHEEPRLWIPTSQNKSMSVISCRNSFVHYLVNNNSDNNNSNDSNKGITLQYGSNVLLRHDQFDLIWLNKRECTIIIIIIIIKFFSTKR